MTNELKDEKAELLKKEKYDFYDLVDIVRILRSKGGCPWDMEQDHKSIRDSLIEETYEAIEAIDTDNSELLREELGDVMLQVVFHARIEEEEKRFSIDDVSDGVCKKLIYRHPHVFSDVNVENSAQVLDNWEKLKNDEKQRKTVTQKLKAVPPQLPALMRAAKVGKKAACFDFDSAQSVMDKLYEEAAELKEALACNDGAAVEEEAGDLLLTMTSLCRKLGVNPERALNNATDKFISRFERLENEVSAAGKDVSELSFDELDALWNEIKHKNL